MASRAEGAAARSLDRKRRKRAWRRSETDGAEDRGGHFSADIAVAAAARRCSFGVGDLAVEGGPVTTATATTTTRRRKRRRTTSVGSFSVCSAH